MKHNTSEVRTFLLIALVAGVIVQGAATFGQNNKSRQRDEMDKKYTETETANLKRVKNAFEAWSNGTGSPYQLLDDNVSWTIVGDTLASKEYKSRESFIDEVIKPFNQRMSKGLVPTIREIHADDDTVIVFFDAGGTARDGKPYVNTYSWFLRFRGDKILHATAFFDSIRFNDLWTRVPVKTK